MNFNILSFIYPKKDDLIKIINPLTFFNEVKFENQFDFKTNDFSFEFLDETKKDELVFTIYDSIYKKYDEEYYKESYLKNSLFVIPPGLFSRELAKTSSLINKKDGDNKSSLFEVLNGEGYFILEDIGVKNIIKLIKIKKGDRVFIPKNNAFVIMNSSQKDSLICFSLSLKFGFCHSMIITKNS